MVIVDLGGLESARLPHQRRLVMLPSLGRRVEGEAGKVAELLDHVDDELVARRLDDGAATPRVPHDVAQAFAPLPGVERHRDHAGAHGAVHDLHELEAVVDRHRHAIARPEPRPGDQVGEPVEPLVEFTIGDVARLGAAKIDDGDLVGVLLDRLPAPVTDVVVGAIPHPFPLPNNPPERERGAL